jgi:F0F1-type ATP synthase membrane subunit c/vacuolar-type H+-ATPase subunit K
VTPAGPDATPARPADHELRGAYRTTTIIAIAMLTSVAAYVVVAEAIRATHAPFRGFAGYPMPGVIGYAFAAMAVASLVMSRVLRDRRLQPATRLAAPAVRSAGPTGSAARRLQEATIVSLALCESIAVLGLVLFLLWGSSLHLYLFVLLAIVGFAVHFPRWERWQERARALARG